MLHVANAANPVLLLLASSTPTLFPSPPSASTSALPQVSLAPPEDVMGIPKQPLLIGWHRIFPYRVYTLSSFPSQLFFLEDQT